jgi:hypothetical protein
LKSIGRGFHLDFKALEEWHNRIVDMLRIHMISLHDENRYVVVIMSDPAAGGGVSTLQIKAELKSSDWKAEEARRRKPPNRKK